jgi:hypothetical protein
MENQKKTAKQRILELKQEIKFTHRVYKIIVLICVVIIGVQQVSLSKQDTSEPPIIIGTGTMEQISDNVYEIKDDQEEYKLPELPKVAFEEIDVTEYLNK